MNLKFFTKRCRSNSFFLPDHSSIYNCYENSVFPDRNSLLACLPILKGMTLSADFDTSWLITMLTADAYYFFHKEGDANVTETIAEWYASGISRFCRSSPFLALYDISRLYELHEWMRPFLRKVVNMKAFLDSIKESYFRGNYWRLYQIMSTVEFLFSGDSVLDIVKHKKTSLTALLVFGSHPVLLDYPELQKDWLYAFIKAPTVSSRCRKFYVTDKVIDSLTPWDAFRIARLTADIVSCHISNISQLKVYFSFRKLVDKCAAFVLANEGVSKEFKRIVRVLLQEAKVP